MRKDIMNLFQEPRLTIKTMIAQLKDYISFYDQVIFRRESANTKSDRVRDDFVKQFSLKSEQCELLVIFLKMLHQTVLSEERNFPRTELEQRRCDCPRCAPPQH